MLVVGPPNISESLIPQLTSTYLNLPYAAGLRLESVQLLQALVKGSHTLIVPYVSQLLGSLMKLLNDQSSAVVGATLSTIGELALASPASVSEHLDVVFPRLIDLLNDSGSISKQEVAVVAMGKLVSSLTMVTEEPYTKFPGLFAALAKAIQNSDDASISVRLQAMRTMGLLGDTINHHPEIHPQTYSLTQLFLHIPLLHTST